MSFIQCGNFEQFPQQWCLTGRKKIPKNIVVVQLMLDQHTKEQKILKRFFFADQNLTAHPVMLLFQFACRRETRPENEAVREHSNYFICITGHCYSWLTILLTIDSGRTKRGEKHSAENWMSPSEGREMFNIMIRSGVNMKSEDETFSIRKYFRQFSDGFFMLWTMVRWMAKWWKSFGVERRDCRTFSWCLRLHFWFVGFLGGFARKVAQWTWSLHLAWTSFL